MIKTRFLLPTLLLLSGCTIPLASPGGERLEVHLQSSFEGQRVTVEIDGQRVFHARATTDHRIGLAEVIGLELSEGRHRIRVMVEEDYVAEEAFDLEGPLYIGVGFWSPTYAPASLPVGLSFTYATRGFGYD